MASGLPPGSPPSGLTDRSGSFFKLIDTFALEIGELTREMVQTSPTVDKEPMDLQGLESEVSGVYLQSPHCGGVGGERDSGYDSLRRRMSVLDRLTQTHPVWLLLSVSEEEACRILLKQPPGVFLVRKSGALQRKVLCVRLKEDQSGSPISHFPVRESQYTFSLEESGISFADLFRLVAFYCISRDVLPFTLKLPEAIASAKTQKELEEVAQLGAGFWDSALCSQRRTSPRPCRPLSRTLSPQRTNRNRKAESSEQRHPGGAHYDSAPPTLRSSTPPSSFQQERRHSRDCLCFVNPLFLQTRHHRCVDHPPSHNNQENAGKSSVTRLNSIQGSEQHAVKIKLNGKSQPPPPRPPPPRSMPRRRPAPPPPGPPAATTRPKSMPEAAAVSTRQQQQSPSRRPAPARPLMGAKHSSQSKTASSPIPVPSNPPPPRPKKPDLEAHRCHIALDDETIAKALSRAKLPPCQPPPAVPAQELPENKAGSLSIPKERGRQRLSDMSMSTSSSDSLEYSQSPGFSLGLAPSPSRHLNHQDTVEDSSEDDEDGEEDEDEDYGVGLETDLEMRLRPSIKARRRRVGVSLGGGGSFILPRALKGRFRKMSGMLSSFMTPERRAVKRIAELSRDKSSYFGSLVQDYISFVQENRGCHTSGMDFLQTLRQFMTQMKAYLRQSSELDPPLESLIPEDQIDQVLEKAMHKCVLKPLKSVIEVALHDFQVSSGALQQLRENLALAKTKRPHELGVDGAVPPDPMAIDKIRHKFLNMRKMYSPEKKVSLLLRVCKLIYTIMQDNSGRMYGADDFLPMLTYVVAQCDMPQLDTDIQYMMELLDPSLLQGEGGYYLTSAYGAMALIRNFQEEQAARVLSSEARNTLHQWHQRRTAQRTAPTVDDFQNYLRVALQEVDTGCTAKTLIVHPYTTTEEVCSLCAYKFKIPEPATYALFLVTGDTRQQLAPDTHPQRIKAELHSRPRAQIFHFVYKRVPNLNLCIPALMNNGNCLQVE
ncbi:ras and Rab interactor 2-like isoform X1 [Etheostoma cragini]|uniref:ras and Rab interactor 2-like isoform X1 n=1 Tax=Etheostoma cragini TaxID=417921 RepID=UPI00155ED3D6|nr:ras and Rab interactor 2-like isoform X1 [Etheostoma cragini]XP_034742315.1 ras and Rab interactor 2-like isoform X1 [Etheostoma cragini]XP_034742323.1 ras and Rab interactor 2-like isoform X1 [Etheostoma cragini]